MEDLRETFRKATGGLTLSAGAAIVHHQAPLGQGLLAAAEALRSAKTVDGKNAFAFNLRIRSGAHSICKAPWETKGRPLTRLLKLWLKSYALEPESEALSPRWFYRFAALEPSIKDEDGRCNRDLVVSELFHILPRQMASTDTALALAAETAAMIAEVGEMADEFENLLSLLHIPLYIHRGGED